jgi:hypothetical protein
MSDEGKPVRMAFSVSSARVQYYDDVIDHLVRAATVQFNDTHRRPPSVSELAAFKRALIRYAVIRHDLQSALDLKIKPSELLNE